MSKNDKQAVYMLLALVGSVVVVTIIVYLFILWEGPTNGEIRTLLLFTLLAVIGFKGYKRNE